MLHTQTGKNRCARLIARICERARLGQDLTYGQVRIILSKPARAHIWRTLTRFSSAWVCNIRVKTQLCVISYMLLVIGAMRKMIRIVFVNS